MRNNQEQKIATRGIDPSHYAKNRTKETDAMRNSGLITKTIVVQKHIV